MVEAFPPLPKPEVRNAGQDDAPAEVAEMLDRLDDAPPDLVRDTLWAYEHLEHKSVKADSAPSRGAWALLRWAREYRSRYFESFLPKAMAAKSKDTAEERNLEHDRKNIEQIRAVLDGPPSVMTGCTAPPVSYLLSFKASLTSADNSPFVMPFGQQFPA